MQVLHKLLIFFYPCILSHIYLFIGSECVQHVLPAIGETSLYLQSRLLYCLKGQVVITALQNSLWKNTSITVLYYCENVRSVGTKNRGWRSNLQVTPVSVCTFLIQHKSQPSELTFNGMNMSTLLTASFVQLCWILYAAAFHSAITPF